MDSGYTSTDSLISALQRATARLAGTCSCARLDAEVLLAFVLGRSRAELYAWPERALSPMEQSRYGSLIRRRADGEPVAYLTGRREFWSIPIEVSRDTLIPRPETELLVEVALCRIPSSRPWHVADLGTGSGAIALAITKERPACHLWATDVSEAALTLARRNAQHHGFGNVEFCQGHWFDPVQGRRFDVILSNPPYVREDDPCLRDGDTRFEPYRALAAGPEGLDAIHLIIRSAGRFLTEGGYLILEHGFDQGEAVKALFAAHGFSELRCHRDLAGHDRVSEGRWRA